MSLTELDNRSLQLVLQYLADTGQVVESPAWLENNLERILGEMEAEVEIYWAEQPRWRQLFRPLVEGLFLLRLDCQAWIASLQRARRSW